MIFINHKFTDTPHYQKVPNYTKGNWVQINGLHFTICEAASKMSSKLWSSLDSHSFDSRKRKMGSEVAKFVK